ncbi:UDP-N-acetylhexosamine pyrophosphorylase-like protein 1 [Tritrichomonas foetus]|uniref:UDP-N-acetylglucosamine diphosphorylase n=1 Tax=Tritrichomonas foetus TaxID=1144522 RepID=A0A1J4KMC0_9EUKA|nr:uDP-N-acetylhexosamine pyrophosphorylase-like protein 1 [Tritrichomonas foetus]OHT12449.1 UDP-N-acetylhexosamine pyrophosphorylase-like protein 1 [Tritrichomonas foetus]|eukprot:OHT12449.1 UDP-N-acetylhexosamine pyrophosphorylase-like protein 1 [Tritrichomonas foetus]
MPDDVAGAVENGKPITSLITNENGLIALSTGNNFTVADCVASAVGSALIPFNFYSVEVPSTAAPELTRFIDKINPVQRSMLASQLRLLDFSEQKTVDTTKTLAALEAVPDPRNFQAEHDKVYNLGCEHIRRGEVAVCIMAGGQGSRLRAPVPKAMMEVDLISKQTLLELQLRRIKRLVTLYGGCKNAPGIPVYILTSDSTHSPIAAYLLENNNFGVPHVFLVKQRQLPARTFDGKFVLSEQWKVMAAPNGNGAIFAALKESGACEDMRRLGVKYLEIHPIDNALAKPADPFMVGALAMEDGDVALKVIRKRPKEKIGTMCKREGKTIVIEYSEIPAGEEEAYVWGNTGLHLYRTDLIEKAAEAELPYHIALKKENVINENGEKVMGDVKKFERFIFDALEVAIKPVLVECVREEEFAPIKNPAGAEFDSPDTARDLVVALHKKWATEAGAKFEGEGAFEFLPETTYGGEGLKELNLAGKTIKLPAQL